MDKFNEPSRHTFTHEDMAKLISVYFKGLEDKDVRVNLCNGEDGRIFANLVEIIRSDKTTKRVYDIMKKEKIESIVREIYDMAGQQVTGIVNYGKEGSTVMERGYTKVVTPELANHVVVTTKPKVLVR